MANETIQRRLNVGSRQQVFPIMIACAITWSIGSMMHSFFAPVSIDSSYHTRRANTIGGNPVPKITYRKVHFLGIGSSGDRRYVFRYMAPTRVKFSENGCR
jgi:hypothetical protein